LPLLVGVSRTPASHDEVTIMAIAFHKLMSSGPKALRTYRIGSSTGELSATTADRSILTQRHVPPPAIGGLFEGSCATTFIVGKRQGAWIDEAAHYCHLCAAPLTDAGKSWHMSFDLDHVALNAFVYLSVMHPRTWRPREVHERAFADPRWRSLAQYAVIGAGGDGSLVSMSAHNPVPFTPDDHCRIEELRALLLYLIDGPSALRVLRTTPFDEAPAGIGGQGEKVFRGTVTELVVSLFPPFGPNIQACFSKKAWGRTNLMLLYDRLRLGEWQQFYDLKPKKDRSDKSAVLREIIVELGHAHVTHASTPVASTLAELCLHRLAFECVVQKSAHYMHQAQQAIAMTGYPTPEDMDEHDFA
jgi:hypothetical protein